MRLFLHAVHLSLAGHCISGARNITINFLKSVSSVKLVTFCQNHVDFSVIDISCLLINTATPTEMPDCFQLTSIHIVGLGIHSFSKISEWINAPEDRAFLFRARLDQVERDSKFVLCLAEYTYTATTQIKTSGQHHHQFRNCCLVWHIPAEITQMKIAHDLPNHTKASLQNYTVLM